MAVKVNTHATAALKAVTYRITSTPTAQLPGCAAQLAASIWTCREILSQPADVLKGDGEASITANKFRNQLSTLLQDRTVEGRWTAVVLLKSVIEAGGVEMLSRSNTWVKNLLSILKKPDPPTTRSTAVLVLTRIFMLTWDYSNLVREITTPALPTFVSTCVSNAEHKRCSKNELQSILGSFEVLIPRHPTIFRTHEQQIRGLVLRIISSTAIDSRYSIELVHAAQKVLILLSQCAAKAGGAEKWNETLENVIKATHQTCDIIFRSVSEDWKSTSVIVQQRDTRKQGGGEPSCDGDDALRLSAWHGIFAGAARVETLLDLVSTHLATSSPVEVTLPLGLIADLFSRLSSITSGRSDSTPPNPQFSKEERDLLYSLLPGIHAKALSMLSDMLEQLGLLATPIIPSLLDQIESIFVVESFDVELRTAMYRTIDHILNLIGSSLDSREVGGLATIVSKCCSDLLPTSDRESADSTAKAKQQSTDLVLQTSKTGASNPAISPALNKAASRLLVTLLSKVKPALMSRKLRTQLDRTAVFTQHKEALLASVLNPAPSPSGQGFQQSLLPLLAKMFPDDAAVESLIRPRMPFVSYRKSNVDDDDVVSDEDGEIEVEERIEQDGAESTAQQAETLQDVVEEAVSESADHAAKRHADEDLSNTASKRSRFAEATDVSTELNAKQDLTTDPFAIESTKSQQTVAFSHTASDVTEEIVSNDLITANEEEYLAGPASTTTTKRVEVPIPVPTALDLDSDDGSDIEIPPLTMNSDSEDE